MRRLGLVLVLVLAVALAAHAGSVMTSPAISPAASAPSWQLPTAEDLVRRLEGLSLREFADEAARLWLLAHPVILAANQMADDLGVRNDRLLHADGESAARLAAIWALLSERLDSYEPDTVEECVTSMHLERLLAIRPPSLWTEEDLSYSWGAGMVDFLMTFLETILPEGTEDDVQNYVACLWQVGEFVDAAILRHARVNAAAGRLPTTKELNEVLEATGQLARLTVLARHPIYEAGVRRVYAAAVLSADAREAYFEQIGAAVEQVVVPAFAEVRRELLSLKSKALTRLDIRLADGQWPAAYAEIVAGALGTPLTPTEIHERAIREVSRLRVEIVRLGPELGVEDPTVERVVEAAHAASHDPGKNVAIFRQLLQSAVASASSAFSQLPELSVEPVVDLLGYEDVIYTISPIGAEGDATAQVRIPQLLMMGCMFPTIVFHETIPGHHVQLALARELGPPLGQQLTLSQSFQEGWAVYGQTLADELELYADAASRAGYLSYLLFLAKWAALETGYLGGIWSREEAIAFGQAIGIWTENDASGAADELDLISLAPYARSTYFVGWVTFLDERQRAMDALGASFDSAAFHDAVLRHGSVPLDALAVIVDDYIDSAGREANLGDS